MVPSYQGEFAHEMFLRAIHHKDIATGEVDLDKYAFTHGKHYSTTGPSDTWWMKNDVLPQPAHECYMLDVPSRCTAEEAECIKNGSAIIEDYILVGCGGDGNDSKQQDSNGDSSNMYEGQIPLLAAAKDW